MIIAPMYKHKAGSMHFVPNLAFASPHEVIILWRKWLSIFCFVFFDLELVIFASMTIVCGGGISLLLIVGCVASMWFLKLAAWIEFRSLFVGHA
jgi:hypothetical protein